MNNYNYNFDMNEYLKHIDNRIYKILNRPEKLVLTYDILDTKKSKQYKKIALKEKQRQMKIGDIWQEVLGSYDGYIDLKVGHPTGLNIMSNQKNKKVAIELKNRTNTDNASSRKANLDKLAKFKMQNPDYLCIYGNVNADTENKTLSGINKKIIHNGQEIEYMVGIPFLNFILGKNTNLIIDFVRKTIDKYT